MRALRRAHHAADRIMIPRAPRPIAFCLTGGRTIFLDVDRNRYFALPSKLAGAFAALSGGQAMGAISPAALAALQRQGGPARVCIEAAQIHGTPCPKAAKSDRIFEQARTTVRRRLTVVALLAAILARLIVLLFPLRLIVSWLEAGECSDQTEADFAGIDRIAQAFRRVGILVKSDGNCLPLTLAFVWMCRRYGHAPAFIIGVRVNPFSAHCWSQCGAIVVNDALDRVRPYQPILVI